MRTVRLEFGARGVNDCINPCRFHYHHVHLAWSAGGPAAYLSVESLNVAKRYIS